MRLGHSRILSQGRGIGVWTWFECRVSAALLPTDVVKEGVGRWPKEKSLYPSSLGEKAMASIFRVRLRERRRLDETSNNQRPAPSVRAL